jgi:DNA-directed RNA polymerase beta' subunit
MGVRFFLLSDDEKKELATYHINGTWNLYMPESGTNFGQCIICKLSKDCTGHYGLLDLGMLMIHPMFISKFYALLNRLKIPKNTPLEDIILPDPYKGLIMRYILVPKVQLLDDIEWPTELLRLYTYLMDCIKSPSLNKIRIISLVTRIFGAEGKTGIMELFSGKDGIFRKICFGKRIEGSARSVITGDPCLDIDQVYIPKELADNLYIKCRVEDNKTQYFLEKSLPMNKFQSILGVDAIRKIKDNDLVFINRQPTLSYGSLLTFRAKIRKDNIKTIGIHPNVTKTFNADFDGDEMNIFCFPKSKDLERCCIINFNECTSDIQDSKTMKYLKLETFDELDSYGLTVSLEDLVNKKYEGTGMEIMVKSKAKGNDKNVEQIIHTVGKQYLYGKEVGICNSSYVKGLDPDEFFIHQRAAREGVVSTGVSTSDTGYINRKGTRIMADVVKDKNGIIRDSYGVISIF